MHEARSMPDPKLVQSVQAQDTSPEGPHEHQAMMSIHAAVTTALR